jgi:hypothetical protein
MKRSKPKRGRTVAGIESRDRSRGDFDKSKPDKHLKKKVGKPQSPWFSSLSAAGLRGERDDSYDHEQCECGVALPFLRSSRHGVRGREATSRIAVGIVSAALFGSLVDNGS